jgi:hypothetical protein
MKKSEGYCVVHMGYVNSFYGALEKENKLGQSCDVPRSVYSWLACWGWVKLRLSCLKASFTNFQLFMSFSIETVFCGGHLPNLNILNIVLSSSKLRRTYVRKQVLLIPSWFNKKRPNWAQSSKNCLDSLIVVTQRIYSYNMKREYKLCVF